MLVDSGTSVAAERIMIIMTAFNAVMQCLRTDDRRCSKGPVAPLANVHRRSFPEGGLSC
jgi:hypothetical protein